MADEPLTLDQAREEFGRMLTDKAHPQYEAFQRGASSARDYADNLFKRAGATQEIPIGSFGITVQPGDDGKPVISTHPFGTEPPPPLPPAAPQEEAAARAEVETALRWELGADYEPVMASARESAGHLFEGQEGRAALEILSERVVEYGPKAEALAMKFLADLGKLKGRTR